MDLIRKYFPELTPQQYSKFERLAPLYVEWNSKINVISRKDITYFYERHLLHSLAIAKVIQFPCQSRILDVGTGGGLPGIPLAIYFPECSFVLIDSIAKKVNVVNAIISELWLKNATAIQVRAEDFHDKFHYVIGRAVTDLGKFMRWVTKNIDQKEIKDPLNGVIYLKGGDLSDEVKPYQDSRIYNISDFFEEEFFVTKKLIYIPISH